MTTKIIGNACIVTSEHSLEDLIMVEKYRPRALSIFEQDEDGNKVEVFKVGTEFGEGTICKHGAVFGGESHDENKFATITIPVPPCLDGKEEAELWFEDEIGVGILNLKKVEEKIGPAIAEIKAEREAVMASLTIE